MRNQTLIALALALGLGTAFAKPQVDREVEAGGGAAAIDVETLEEVRSIPALTRLHGFHVIDADTLIVWRNAFDPYLVELRHPSPHLRFAWSVGISQRTGRIYAGFDDVHVDGLRYPIHRIYRLEREQAKALSRRS